MPARLPVAKTYKLYINGQFPRSESGRSLRVTNDRGEAVAHIAHASRKDLRDAVSAARAAADAWSRRAAYNRGQILYRMTEMIEARRSEFIELLGAANAGGGGAPSRSRKAAGARAGARTAGAALSPSAEVDLAADRLIAFAGWADKFGQVLGSHNPVNGPYYNFTVPEATGVIVALAPDAPALLGLVSAFAPVLCAGGVAVCVASESAPVVGAVFAEAVHTSDVPPGVLNVLTGKRDELIKWIAEHREIDAVHALNLPEAQEAELRAGAAENLKRVTTRRIEPSQWTDAAACENPWWIEPFVEFKTIWHPSAM